MRAMVRSKNSSQIAGGAEETTRREQPDLVKDNAGSGWRSACHFVGFALVKNVFAQRRQARKTESVIRCQVVFLGAAVGVVGWRDVSDFHQSEGGQEEGVALEQRLADQLELVVAVDVDGTGPRVFDQGRVRHQAAG